MVASGWLGKYKALFLSFLAFIFILATVLILNYRWSLEIDSSTARLDAVGEMSDEMLFLNNSLNTLFERVDRLVDARESLDTEMVNELRVRTQENIVNVKDYIELLDGGGFYEHGGDELESKALNEPTARAALNHFIAIFKEIETGVSRSIDGNGQISLPELQSVTDYANQSIYDIYDDMDTMYTVYLQRSFHYSLIAKYSQIAMAVAAVIYFLVFLLYFIRRLNTADERLLVAQGEVDNIMRTIKDGLFLVDPNLQISSQYSANLEHILGRTDIANRSLEALLADMLSERDMKATKIFVQQLLNPKVVANLIEELNPLSRVQVLVESGAPIRWLSFGFSRVMEGNEIVRVLVSVSDVTDAVNLEQRLVREKKKHDEQLDMLASIIHVDDNIMNEFMIKSSATMQRINAMLREGARTEDNLRQKLEAIFREVHSLKGESSVVDLRSYVTLCQTFEAKVCEIQQRRKIQGGDFLSLTIFLEELAALNEKVQYLYQRIGRSAHEVKPSIESTTASTLVSSLEALAHNVAKREEKSVQLISQSLDQIAHDEREPIIKDILVQLVRNAITHGIEVPEVRKQHNKPVQGTINVSVDVENNRYCLEVKDDGRGIDFTHLATLAARRGIAPDKEGGYSNKALLRFMLTSGVSTATEVGEDAGQGVGMDVVANCVRQLQGQLIIKSQLGAATCFKIFFPIERSQ